MLYIAGTTMVMTHGQSKQLERPVEDLEMWLQRECSQDCPGENRKVTKMSLAQQTLKGRL